ncbi:MAG: response regulator [Nitrospirota bacterium]|nr:response regulator [Nitrospirota bacterium]
MSAMENKPVSVLVVDDDAEMTDLLVTVLTDAGYRATSASGPEEALAVIRDNPPRLVVSDLSMPTASGLELLEEVRATLPDLHFIILTAFGDWASFCRAQDLRVDSYLTKPVAMQQLLAEVAAILAADNPGPPHRPKP